MTPLPQVAANATAIRNLAARLERMPLRIQQKIDVDESSGCWLWTAAKHHSGYGAVSPGAPRRGMVAAHRFVYELVVGPIPENRELDHLCRVRHCVNPAHLEPVTHRVNMLRGETIVAEGAKRQCCPAGHPYAGANLRTSEGCRRCRQCVRERKAAERARQRGLV